MISSCDTGKLYHVRSKLHSGKHVAVLMGPYQTKQNIRHHGVTTLTVFLPYFCYSHLRTHEDSVLFRKNINNQQPPKKTGMTFYTWWLFWLLVTILPGFYHLQVGQKNKKEEKVILFSHESSFPLNCLFDWQWSLLVIHRFKIVGGNYPAFPLGVKSYG